MALGGPSSPLPHYPPWPHLKRALKNMLSIVAQAAPYGRLGAIRSFLSQTGIKKQNIKQTNKQTKNPTKLVALMGSAEIFTI